MSFYTPNVKHPQITRRWSGELTLTSANPAPLSTTKKYCANGVWVKNEDDTLDIRVFAPTETEGFLLSANTSRFFPDDDVSKIFVAPEDSDNAGSGIIVSYWGG